MKKTLFIFIFIILIIFSLVYPSEVIAASKSGLLIWFNQILPALLPFTILSSLLLKTNLLKSFSKNGNLAAIGTTLCCGFIFGFPIGAKLASDFYAAHLLTKKQADILSVTTNNFSPMYVCGYVLPAIFPDTNLLLSTYLFVYLLPLVFSSVYLILTYKNEQKNICETTTEDFFFSMPFLDESIMNGFQILIRLCGYIVSFSILTQIAGMLFDRPSLLRTILLGNMEITNGIQLLSVLPASAKEKYTLMIQLLTFGGLSGIAQTNSIFGVSKLSIYKYIIGKAALSLLLTLLTVIYISFLFI